MVHIILMVIALVCGGVMLLTLLGRGKMVDLSYEGLVFTGVFAVLAAVAKYIGW